jgi:hypothetical protein
MRRRILIISRNETAGRRLRSLLAGRYTGLPTTVVGDLTEGVHALKRLHPEVVIFVDEGASRADDRLMLLRTLLLLEERSQHNTLALVYDLVDGRLSLYHNVHFPSVEWKGLAELVADSRACPLFGYSDEFVKGFPSDCRFLGAMARGSSRAGSRVATDEAPCPAACGAVEA